MKKIIVNSLPKSGTNLIAKLLNLLEYDEVGHIGAGQYLNSSPKSIINRLLSINVRQGYIIGIDNPIEVNKRPIDNKLCQLNSGEYITSHIGYTNDILELVARLDITPIVVIRDPRAVLASYVPYVLSNASHPLHSFFHKQPDFQRYKLALCGFNDSKFSLQPLRIRCSSLQPWLDSPRSIVIRFEDIIGSQGGGNDKVQTESLKYLFEKIEIDEAEIDNVKINLFGPGRGTFRKGKIDSWRDELSDSVIDLINKDRSTIFKNWGYEK